MTARPIRYQRQVSDRKGKIFYTSITSLSHISKQEGNVIMSEGLVLQDVNVWYVSTQIPTTPHNNMNELYFEENDMEGLNKKSIKSKKIS